MMEQEVQELSKNIIEFADLAPVLAQKAIGIALALLLFFLATKIINKLIAKGFKRIISNTCDIEAKKQLDTASTVVTSTVAGIMGAFALLHVLNTLGIDIRPLIATAGVAGVAVGLGAKRFVEDVISGILILLGKQAKVGDSVKINGIAGTVEHVNLRLVTLRSLDGTVHYIRNGLIDIISNSTRDFSVAVFDLHISHNEDVLKVIDTIKLAGKELAQREEYKDFIIGEVNILGLDRFEPNTLVIKFTIKTLPARQWEIQRVFNLMLKQKFDSLGISLAQKSALTVCNVVD